jgi:hypothetical protein
MLDPPDSLDAVALFADDGIVGGPQEEVLHAMCHLQVVMPRVRLQFSKLEVIPAKVNGRAIDRNLFESHGFTVNMSGNFEVMKSPLAGTEFCEELVMKRVRKTAEVYKAFAAIPSRLAAFYLARFQMSRMNYVVRTTPKALCSIALAKCDASAKSLLENLIDKNLSATHWEVASLPVRVRGVGFQSIGRIADAAYVSSRAMTQDRVSAAYQRTAGGENQDRDWDTAAKDCPEHCQQAR